MQSIMRPSKLVGHLRCCNLSLKKDYVQKIYKIIIIGSCYCGDADKNELHRTRFQECAKQSTNKYLFPSQAKVLSMSRVDRAGSVPQLLADIPLLSRKGEASSGRNKQCFWERWSSDCTEHRVAKLMEEDIGAAMQFLHSKSLCIMPISLVAAIYHLHNEPETPP